MPWSSLLAFVRLVASPRVFERPRAIPDAWRQVEEWLECAPVWIPAAGVRWENPILSTGS